MNYKILIDNHDYNNWNFIDPITGNPIKDNDLLNSIKPIEHKMFTRDYFTIHDNDLKIVESYYRQAIIPGILILQGNKTYGRHGKKLLYKCIPGDLSDDTSEKIFINALHNTLQNPISSFSSDAALIK